MLKNILSVFINLTLFLLVVVIQFLLASQQSTFDFWGVGLTAEQLGFISQMIVGFFFIRMAMYLMPAIKSQLKKWFE